MHVYLFLDHINSKIVVSWLAGGSPLIAESGLQVSVILGPRSIRGCWVFLQPSSGTGKSTEHHRLRFSPARPARGTQLPSLWGHCLERRRGWSQRTLGTVVRREQRVNNSVNSLSQKVVSEHNVNAVNLDGENKNSIQRLGRKVETSRVLNSLLWAGHRSTRLQIKTCGLKRKQLMTAVFWFFHTPFLHLQRIL